MPFDIAPDDIVLPSAANRMVSWPYTKLLCSNEQVDQGAGLIVCSVAAARRLGVAEDRWVFPVATAEAKDVYVSERWDLATSPMVGAAGRLLWSMAGVGPGDVDVACLYDAFTPLVLVQLEDYGFCAKGEAAGFYADTSLPINPHGGHLSEGYVHGLNHAAAAVAALRDGASVALSTGQPGYVAGSTSAVVLKADR